MIEHIKNKIRYFYAFCRWKLDPPNWYNIDLTYKELRDICENNMNLDGTAMIPELYSFLEERYGKWAFTVVSPEMFKWRICFLFEADAVEFKLRWT